MKLRNPRWPRILDPLWAIAVALGAAFWVIESALHTLFFGAPSFKGEILNPGMHELWMRSLVLGLLLGFALYARRTMSDRQWADVELRRERDTAQRYLNIAGVILVAIDEHGTVTLINNAGCKILGYREDEVLGKNWFGEFLPEAVRENVVGVFQELVAGRTALAEYYENPVLTRSGEERLIAWHNTILRNDAGQTIGTLSSGEDITERRRTEEALQAERDFARSLIETAPAIMLLLDKRGHIVHINPYMEELSGYRLEEVQGRDWFSTLLPERDRERIHKLFKTALSGTQTRGNVNSIVTKDGRERQIVWHDTSRRDADGNPVALLCIGQDVTEHRQAEEALRARERQQAMVADLGHRALAGIALDDLFNEAVRNVADTLQVEYCKVLELLPEGCALHLRAGVGWSEGLVGSAAVGTERESQAGFTLITDGPVVVADLRTETRFTGPQLLHDHGVVSGISTVIRGGRQHFGVLGAHTTRRRAFTEDDVHFISAVANVLADAVERKRAEEQLRHYAQTQAVLLREVNHRVKNNLSALIAMLHKEEDRACGEGMTSHLPMLHGLERRVQGLSTVHSLLTAGGWHSLALSELCKRVVQGALQGLPASKRIKLDVSPSKVKVNSRQAHHLTLVLNELATNTLKHALTGRDAVAIHVQLEQKGDRVTIRFHDDGPGLPEEMIHGDLDRAHVGYELIHGIVTQSLGGEVHMNNNNGAEVTVTFILEDAAAGVEA